MAATARKIEMHYSNEDTEDESVISIPRVNTTLTYTELKTVVEQIASLSEDQVKPYLVETTPLADLAKGGN